MIPLITPFPPQNVGTMVVPISPYRWQDHLVADIGRIYSEERHEPFFVAIGNYPDFDLRAASGSVSIEVKCETTPSRTGNLAFEYWNVDFQQPSGVLSTKADLWLHIALIGSSFTAFEFTIDGVRKMAVEQGSVVSNGRNALCKIVPVDVCRSYASRIFTLAPQFVQSLRCTIEGAKQ